MKGKIASIMILLGVMAAFGFSASHYAGSSDSETGCSNATLKGTYGFYRTGTIPDGPLAAVGILNYDGNGHNSYRQINNRNGVLESVAATVEYQVASDCTSKTFLDGEQIASGVIVDNGNRLFFISRSGNTVNGFAEKIHKK